jgi:two-component system sensor histidine kinase HydH
MPTDTLPPPTADAPRAVSAALAQQLADLAEMTGGFVHDMKNHLGTVLLNLDLLAEDFADAQTHKDRRALERITLMRDECRRLVNLSNDFLRVARVEDLHAEPTPLDAVVGRMIDFLGPTARQKGIAINWYPAADLPPVLLDAELFEKVLLNLMLNAEDAMPCGGELTLQSRPDGAWVALDVIDTGCGIPPELLPKLFKPFLTTKDGGNGLGLATAKKVVTAHGGLIEVQSEPGRGTKFTIKLPAAGDPPGR